MSPGTTILAAFITLAAIYGIVSLSLSVKRVPPGHARNVTRLPLTYARWDTERERHRTLGPGWHLVFPGRDQVGGPIDLREQAVTLNGQRVLTAGRASVTVNTKLSFQITDPLAAVTVGDQIEAVAKLVPMMLSQIIASTGPGQRLAARSSMRRPGSESGWTRWKSARSHLRLARAVKARLERLRPVLAPARTP
jgi:regulator of protease activity HflC (stomatin/prohibitin superfamily)